MRTRRDKNFLKLMLIGITPGCQFICYQFCQIWYLALALSELFHAQRIT